MAVKEQVIYTEDNELILLLKGPTGSGRQPQNIPANRVQSVFFGYSDDKLKMLLTGKKRRITVTVPKLGAIEFDEYRHSKYFEQYLQMLKTFCEKYNVTFNDFPAEK